MSLTVFPRKRNLFAVFLLLIVGQMIAGLVAMVFTGVSTGSIDSDPPDWMFPIIYIVGLAPALYYTWRRLDRPRVSVHNVSTLSPRWVAVLSIAILLISFGMGIVAGYLPTADYLDAAIDNLEIGIGTFLAIVFLAPVLEEYLLRGLLLDRMLQQRSPQLAIFLSALLFGVMHIIPAHIFAAFFAGLALGYVYYRTRSLGLVILLHVVNNGVAYASKFFDESADDPYGLPVMLVIAAGTTALGAWLLHVGAQRVALIAHEPFSKLPQETVVVPVVVHAD
ncbi:hypothetical protein LEM8419_03011 [Neolewinella maritima]|uniref:CAAX prenyl protease 2/Lysostaphin resistance protein A-like domain-containing protein n=1 Tax=Neolewinella maritima TaxID=1383882 RepID=A0ABM9B433_9BACT|nr:type II CAAX endopeptidase family protein [Neolewinella maritima]CAH1002094.1 hypothetical protein LEM8419_03011 [Neolewinella maritima]